MQAPDTARTLEIRSSVAASHVSPRELVDKSHDDCPRENAQPARRCAGILGGIRPQHAPGPKAYVRIEARPRSRPDKKPRATRIELALQAAPFVAFRRTNRHDFARDIDQLARRAAIGSGGAKYRVPSTCFSRVYLIAGKTSLFVIAMNG